MPLVLYDSSKAIAYTACRKNHSFINCSMARHNWSGHDVGFPLQLMPLRRSSTSSYLIPLTRDEDIFQSLLGGCCSVTVGGDLPYRQSTMSPALTTGKRVQWNRAHALESDLCSHHSSQTNLLDDLRNNPSSL